MSPATTSTDYRACTNCGGLAKKQPRQHECPACGYSGAFGNGAGRWYEHVEILEIKR